VEYHSFSAMSTTVLAGAEGSLGQIVEGFKRMEELVREYERRFTRFSDDSELSSLNRTSGHWCLVSPEMYEVLRLAKRFYLETDGLFDPAILPALERAGYDRSIEKVQSEGAPERAAGASGERADFGQMELADQRLAVRLPAGLRIDLGGIAKGWIAEQAAHMLYRYTSACAVNAGGDQFSLGLPAGERYWEVGLEDPFEPSRDLASLWLSPGAVATSSVIKRRWKQGQQERHHLIGPRSGQPAHSPWASVTVISDSAAKAEVLAKALLIAGKEDAEPILSRYAASAFIAVDLQGQMWGSENSKEYFYERVG
jgi:FAD:protein FMN transferase